MVVLPPGFVKTKYIGYFWHIPSKVLYSIKGGSLKPMKLYKDGFWAVIILQKDTKYQLKANGGPIQERVSLA